MRRDEHDSRRIIPVRLIDVPADKRLSAARQLCKSARDETEKTELLYAALFPSNRIFWIAA